jgi:hypothetical protein
MSRLKKALKTTRRSSSVTALVILSAISGVFSVTQQVPRADVILEVTATHTTTASNDTYIYLRVWSDRTAEFQALKDRNSEKKDFPIIKKSLAQDEFMQVKSLLSDPKLARVGPRYETRYAIVDTSTEWVIKIPRPGRPQIIQILEFSPGLARTMKHPYPDALVKLGCGVQNLRAELSGERDSLDHECKRVIGNRGNP